VLPGIDTRTGQGYIHAAPTIHKVGGADTYRWDVAGVIPPIPFDLLKLLPRTTGDAASPISSDVHHYFDTGFTLPDRIKDGERHDVFVRYVGQLRNRGVPLKEALRLLRDAWNRTDQPPAARYPMPWGDVVDILDQGWDRWRPGPGTLQGLDLEDAESATSELELRVELELTRREIKRLADQAEREQRAAKYPRPRAHSALDLQLIIDPNPTIKYMLPRGGKVVLAAGDKAGKTTLMTQLMKSLADGTEFLGVAVDAPDAVVGVIDLEMSPGMHGAWIAQRQLKNVDRVFIWPMRGAAGAFDITSDVGLDSWVAELRELNVNHLIIDPVGTLLNALGIDENSNAEVGNFLERLDQLQAGAKLDGLIVSHHTRKDGRGAGFATAVGAGAFSRWPDMKWSLVGSLNGPRYFQTEGRIDNFYEREIGFSDAGQLVVTGSRRGDTNDKLDEDCAVLVLILANHTEGLSTNRLRAAMSVEGIGQKARQSAAMERLEERGLAIVESFGPGKQRVWKPAPGGDNGQ
jgi:AAA domain